MATMMQESTSPPTPRADGGGWAARLLVPEFWGAIAIVAMWVAVIFVAEIGGDMTFGMGSGYGTTVIPTVVGVALFAMIGTTAVAKRAFGRAIGRNRE